MSKHILEIGTDGAAICAYDPSILPDDFDEKYGGDRADLIEELAGDGKAWHDETGGDGSFVVHIYLEEAPILEPYVEERVIEQSAFMPLSCPSGLLVICGAEYVIKDLVADEVDGDTQILTVPAGDYRLRFWRVDMDAERERSKIKPIWQTHAANAAFIAMLLLGFGVIFFAGSAVWSSITYVYRWATDFLPCPCQRSPIEILGQLGKAALCAASTWVALQVNQAIERTPAAIAYAAKVREANLATPDYILELQAI